MSKKPTLKDFSFQSDLRILARLGRVKFLVYSPILYTLGAVLADAAGVSLRLDVFVLGLLFTWNTHLMTHFFNEYYDLQADRENLRPSPWTGGSRVLVEGLVSPRTSLRLGRWTCGLSLFLTCLMPTLQIQAVCLTILFFAWGYSAPPLALNSRGLGELTVAWVLNVLVPLLGFLLQGGVFGDPLIWLLAPLALIEVFRMMVMNMADRVGDQRAGKHTLVVRLGMASSVEIHAAGMACAYLLLIPLALIGTPKIPLLLIAATLPMAAWQSRRLFEWRNSERIYSMPFWASTHNGLAAAAALIGVLAVRPATSTWPIEILPLAIFFVMLAKGLNAMAADRALVADQAQPPSHVVLVPAKARR